MTNLLWGFPDLSYTKALISHTTENISYPAENVILGGRDRRFRTNAAATSSNIVWDAGSGTKMQPSFLILTEVHKFIDKLVVGSTIDVDVDLDDNTGFTTPQNFTEAVGKADLLGPNNEDYYADLTTDITGPDRYARVTIDTGTDSFIHSWGKVYFGDMFDPGRDPVEVTEKKITVGRSQIRRLALRYRGLTDATRTSIQSTLQADSNYAGFFLYDPGDDILDGDRLLHVRLVSTRSTVDWKDSNSITLVVEEML